jgi:hypothetical protein
MIPKTGQLRVWWIPQVPGKPFHVLVENVEKAVLVINTLTRYDEFQLLHKIKPDYSNAGGLEIYQDGEWSEYYDDKDRDINEIVDIEVQK